MKDRLLISFSGGKTSAYMTWWLLNEWPLINYYDVQIVFANTGKEDEGTLEFIEKCSKKWGINITWVEAVHVQSKKGKWYGVRHKIVDFKTAARKGEPFEDMISKLGIPSTNVPHCSKQLKKEAIISYCRSIGWGPGYYKAVGMRIDEIDRMSEDFKREKIVYPFIKFKPTNKAQVEAWWNKQSFNLNLDRLLGNCDACWKKDMKTLTSIAKKYPEKFDWWQDMTDKYGHLNPNESHLKPPFNFYRGNNSPEDIFKMAKLEQQQLELFAEDNQLNGCSDHCEAF